MQVGSLLFSERPDLFSNAMEQLSNQLSLALVKNPGMLRSTSKNSSDQKQVSCDCHSASSAAVSNSDEIESPKSCERMKRVAFRKYVLPKNSPPEYYQCMDCGERRTENSFQNDHLHFGKKPKVRWYCPLCMSFFAVTHRSGHIKCKHSETSEENSSPRVEVSKRFERSDNEVVMTNSSTSRTSTMTTLTSTCQEEEERCEVPTKKRICSNEQETNYYHQSSSPVFSSPSVVSKSLATAGIAFTYAVPPPGRITSSTAALVADKASSILNFFSFISTSVAAPTSITPTPPDNFASLSCNFSLS